MLKSPIRLGITLGIVMACAMLIGQDLVGEAQARKIYRYRDSDGILHIGNPPPPPGVEYEARIVEVDPAKIITSRQEATPTGVIVHLQNHWHGPVLVKISVNDAENIKTDPPVPANVVIEGQEEAAALRVDAADLGKKFQYQVSYLIIPGDPKARHDNSFYQLPFRRGQHFRVSQGFGGIASHQDEQSYYAVDIEMPEGTPVLAARDGVVMHVEEDFHGSGTDLDRYGNRANSIRILHEDGTMGVYAHLQLESASVKPGATVLAGELIGLSGNTGYSTGPHLHFVIQRNTGKGLKSVPFRFKDSYGEAIRPEAGQTLRHRPENANIRSVRINLDD